ncbi:MAG TPA: hypothetical protein VK430_09665 [Xanthobacteraceae bacterium]|nr:hypothetical protein [Xanthobacteraceae bacterium]
MRFVIARFIVAALAAALMIESVHAQGLGGGPGGGRRQHQQKASEPDAKKPKVDDKAYNAALKSLPDKPFDPWHNAR